MADNKKMSVEEILAAARASKAGGAAPAPKPAPKAASESAGEPAASEAPAAPAKPAAAKPAGGKPGAMSVADILAAARGQKAQPAAEAPAPAAPAPAAEKPAAPKPAPKPKPAEGAPAAKAPALDTASILAAARGAGKPGPLSKAEAKEKGVEPPVKKKAEAPPMPAKPEYAKAKTKAAAAESRRGFFSSVSSLVIGSSLALGFSSLAVTHLLWVLGLARYLFPNVLTEPPTKFKVGFPDTLAPGQVDERFKAQFGVWIVKHEYEGQRQIFALKTVCTHLGCTPNWLEAEQKYKCPCHGSGFYKDGVNFEGPAPRPLERYAIRVSDDGQLEVDKSRVFHEETGQWKDTASFVPS